MPFTRVDLLAASVSLLTVGTLVLHISMTRSGNGPAAWFVTVLALAAVAAGYGAVRTVPHRPVVLATVAALLLGAGLLAVFSIGPLLLVTGVSCVVAAARAVPR